MFAFTKPTNMTRAMKKNKQKASSRAREREYWRQWNQNWDFRRNCLHNTFRLWSGKEKQLLSDVSGWRPTRWVNVVKGPRATIPDFVMRANLWCLKKTLHCLSMKDIAWDFYNELIEWEHIQYAKERALQKKNQKDQKKFQAYLDLEIVSSRQKKALKKKKKKGKK
jgi:hypothetical protein